MIHPALRANTKTIPSSIDWQNVYLRLLEGEALLANVKIQGLPQLMASSDNAKKEFARQVESSLDDLVASVRQRAHPVFIGTVNSRKKTAGWAKHSNCFFVESDSSYASLAKDVALRSGVALLEGADLKYGKIPRTQFTADMLAYIVGATSQWYFGEDGSYHARKEALAGVLCQPYPILSNEVYFDDFASLVGVVKTQYRKTNPSDSFGKISVLDGIREMVRRQELHTDPVVVIVGVTHDEASNVAALFDKKPAFRLTIKDSSEFKSIIEATRKDFEQHT